MSTDREAWVPDPLYPPPETNEDEYLVRDMSKLPGERSMPIDSQANETLIAQANDVAPDEDDQSPTPPGLEELTDEQRAQYEATVANAQAAQPTLQKIELAAMNWEEIGHETTSIRIKKYEEATGKKLWTPGPVGR